MTKRRTRPHEARTEFQARQRLAAKAKRDAEFQARREAQEAHDMSRERIDDWLSGESLPHESGIDSDPFNGCEYRGDQ
jgi:hypothetical protein